MGYPPLEDLLPKAGYSIYKLVRMASIRASELADGRPRLIEAAVMDKSPTVALEEIRQGKVVLKEVAKQFAPPEEVQKKKPENLKEEEAL